MIKENVYNLYLSELLSNLYICCSHFKWSVSTFRTRLF